jgi:hypothetical protein
MVVSGIAVVATLLLAPWVRNAQRAASLGKGLIRNGTGHFDGSGITDRDMAALANSGITKLFLADNLH